ncbi:kinase subunit of RNA polymerase II carboxy-terminal domain kinase I [Penicillium diatomitis]|uniref:Kinase subunit of RNA polymerase II carboxy-terminal domain kinase I n=1 Tax=Penicillium diatomitis TaxID=2819901 RepID=A0A9X0C2L7_9EURO|nr:kinase subunit of RNA polymerase II carboxy-terminal domain kinase I [Penicillium diatomitis]KAJ5495295.1 kinase subunit of RNA polymerase II carboxy-terminal domain kinase I [Penicillium diatomitis]
MAGTHRSPILRDSRSGDLGRESRDTELRRGRGSNRDRGRGRYYDRGGRSSQSSKQHYDNYNRSPPRGPRLGSDALHASKEFPSNRSTRPSPGPASTIRDDRKLGVRRSSISRDWGDTWDSNPTGSSRTSLREHSPSAPLAKRKRTRSPSPHSQRPPPRPRPFQNGNRRDRSPPSGPRGRLPGRGGIRGRDRWGKDHRRSDNLRSARSRSPARSGNHGNFRVSPDHRPRSPVDEQGEKGSRPRPRPRSLSRHSARSAGSKESTSSTFPQDDSSVHKSRAYQTGRSGHDRPHSPGHSLQAFNGNDVTKPNVGRGESQNGPFEQRQSSSRPPRGYTRSPSPGRKSSSWSRYGTPPPRSPNKRIGADDDGWGNSKSGTG